MPSQFSQVPAKFLELFRLRTPGAYRARRAAATILAVSPPLICAWFATGSNRWDLFERSGSITSAIGLLLASRQYLRHGIHELAILRLDHQSTSSMVELVDEIHTAKLGLALSAFGTIIWGWGKLLGWWSFCTLIVWAVIAARDAWSDFIRLRHSRLSVPRVEKSNDAAGPRS